MNARFFGGSMDGVIEERRDWGKSLVVPWRRPTKPMTFVKQRYVRDPSRYERAGGKVTQLAFSLESEVECDKDWVPL